MEENNNEVKRPFILFRLLAFLLVPVSLCLFLVLHTVTTPGFYAGLLKRADLVTVFVKFQNREIDNAIENAIEKDVQLKRVYEEFERREKELEEAQTRYDSLNNSEEYETLLMKKKEIKDREFSVLNDIYTSKSEFKRKNKEELELVEKQIRAIEKDRRFRGDTIGRVEKDLERARERYEEAEEVIEKADKKVQKIIESKKDSFVGKLFEDLKIVGPILNRELNNKLIDKAVKPEIAKVLDFLTDFDAQIKAGRIFYTEVKGDMGDGAALTELNIQLPDIKIDMMVDHEIRGETYKRHFFAEVLPDMIRQIEEPLHHKNKLIFVFKTFDNGLIEVAARKRIKDYNLTIRNGVLTLKPTVIKGQDALLLEQAMKKLGLVKKLKWLILLLPLLLLILLFIGSGKGGFKQEFAMVFYHQSLLFLLGSVVLMFLSGPILKRFLSDYSEGVVGAYLSQGTFSLMFNLLFSSIICFAVAFLISIICRRKLKAVTAE